MGAYDVPAACLAYVDEPAKIRGCMLIMLSYGYYPEQNAAAVIAAAFAVVTLVMVRLTLRYRNKWAWVVVLTGALEIVGYLTRALIVKNPGVGLLMVSQLMLLLPPILLALVNYSTMGLLLSVSGHPVLRIPPAKIAKWFLFSDIFTLFVQANGIGLGMVDGMNKAGSGIALFGMVIQIAFFTAFCYVIHTAWTKPEYGLASTPSVQPALRGLAVTIGLLYVRGVYRAVEFGMQTGGVGSAEEWPFFLFETVPILLTMAAYAHWHFGRLLPAGDTAEWRVEVTSALKLVNGGVGMADKGATAPVAPGAVAPLSYGSVAI